MLKKITTLLLLSAFFTAQSQTKDSVSTGASNINDVYYSFTNRIVKTQPNNNWDLAFEINGFAASIRANHVKGIVVYQSPYSYAKWSTFDTAGYSSWKKMYNSAQDWSLGAFNLHHDDMFDLGWGTYDQSTHVVAGDSIFLIKLANGSFKKLTILSLASGIYNFKYSDVDGSNEEIKAVDKLDFKNKNFGYYSFDTKANIDREPLAADWDIVFTKYTEFIPGPYNVGGVWTNKGVTTAEVRKVAVTTTDYVGLTFSANNSEIGYDWKTYNQPLNKYVIADSLVYFVKKGATVTKLVYTGYKGGADGKYYFNKQLLTASAKFPTIVSSTIYPNPSNGVLNIKLSPDNSLVNFTISSISGEMIRTGNESSVDISNLSQGVYFINLVTDKGIQNLKFTKI